jgi:hypothetical protein
MAPFDQLTQQEAEDLLKAPDGYEHNRLMYDGDHWGPAGCFWIGPRPAQNDAGASDTMTQIARALISKNVIAEVVRRHVGGCLGRPMAWSLSLARPLADGEQPTADEQVLIQDATALIRSTWDARGLGAMLQDAAATLLLAGRAPLRLYVPSGLLDDGQIPAGDLVESMALIYADPAPDPTAATVANDESTRQDVGIYAFTEGKATAIELSYLDNDLTFLRRLDQAEPAYALDFGGRLPLYEMRRPQLITPQVRQQQQLLNLSLTMLGRNVVLGGFLERILLNAQLPGTMIKGADGITRFVAAPFQVGAGTTNVLAGIPIRNDLGEITGYTTPSVIYRDPVRTDTFVETKDAAYRGILEEVQQLHAIISGDAAASGESREQARADFITSLSDTETQIEQAGRWLIETLLAMASAFAGQPGHFAALRATVACRIDAGPISALDQGATRDNVAAGLLSVETGMERIGVEDTAAELARIASEREAAATLQTNTTGSILARAGLLAQEARNGGGNGAG